MPRIRIVVAGDVDQRGDQAGHPDGLHVGLGQVPVQLAQVEQREQHAQQVDDDPQGVEYVVPERAVHQRTPRTVAGHLGARGQRTAHKRRAQVDGDGCEPYHERAEHDALRRVQQKWYRRHLKVAGGKFRSSKFMLFCQIIYQVMKKNYPLIWDLYWEV